MTFHQRIDGPDEAVWILHLPPSSDDHRIDPLHPVWSNAATSMNAWLATRPVPFFVTVTWNDGPFRPWQPLEPSERIHSAQLWHDYVFWLDVEDDSDAPGDSIGFHFEPYSDLHHRAPSPEGLGFI